MCRGSGVTTVTAVATGASRAVGAAGGSGTGNFRALVDPALNTDDTVQSASLSETVVDGGAQGLKRYFTFAILLSAGDISTTQTAGATYADTLGAEVHSELNGTLHGAAEGNTALKLSGDVLGHELGVELRLADFHDVELNLSATAKLAESGSHVLDVLTLGPDDETGASGSDGNADAVPSALDGDAGDSGGSTLKLYVELSGVVLDELTDFEVLVELGGVVLAGSIPLGAPVFSDGQTEADRIYFLSHSVCMCACVVVMPRRWRGLR